VKNLEWVTEDRSNKIFIQSGGVALLIVVFIVTGIGWQQHWLAHPKSAAALDEERFVMTEMIQVPEKAHLVEEHKKTPSVPKPEATLSKTPGKGKTSPQPSQSLEEENQTQEGPPPIALSHGPIVLYSPPPVIPPYLQNQELKTHVVIDFYVNSLGVANPRLVGSSGNEELDAIALETIKKWQFRPAEQEGKPIDSKVRLRIVFEVK
jgi:TonB family protein